MKNSTLSFFEPCSLNNLQFICKTFLAGFIIFFATIANAQSTTENVTACNSYTWSRNNTTYTSSGT